MSTKPALSFVMKATDIPVRSTPSIYPTPFAKRMERRSKRALGDHFGLRNFGVNLVTLQPGAVSALRHAHSRQDEFIYVLSGAIRLEYDAGVFELSAGMCAGFSAQSGNAHCLRNASSAEAVYLEAGDRTSGDVVTYPDDDLKAERINDRWVFSHKDGRPY